MNECVICKTECNGTTCSGSCRAKLSRRTRTQESEAHAPSARKEAHATIEDEFAAVDDGMVSMAAARLKPTLQHYQDNPAMYAQRTNPTLINWSKPMSLRQLDKAGPKANRVPIPGDHDYSGCCGQVGDKWQVTGKD